MVSVGQLDKYGESPKNEPLDLPPANHNNGT